MYTLAACTAATGKAIPKRGLPRRRTWVRVRVRVRVRVKGSG